MAAFSDFYGAIRPDVPNCPDFAIDEALNRASRLFCEQTYALSATVVVSTVPGMDEYRFDVEERTLLKVLSVFCDSRPLMRTAITPLRETTPAHGAPIVFNEAGGLVELYPIPDNSYRLTVELAFAPTAAADELHDTLADRWGEALIAGAKADLLSIRSKDWTDFTLAEVHKRRFSHYVSQAKRARLYYSPPQFVRQTPLI
jgi:hypothetical protein